MLCQLHVPWPFSCYSLLPNQGSNDWHSPPECFNGGQNQILRTAVERPKSWASVVCINFLQAQDPLPVADINMGPVPEMTP